MTDSVSFSLTYSAKIDVSKGERWFCSIYDAREHVWKSYKEYN